MQELIFNKEIITNKVICRALGVLTFIICTALGAFVRIPLPFTPVPITLQTFFVLLSGAFLGARLGGLAQASYIFLGMLGLPVFTGSGSGLVYFSGPTSGYLVGFFFASLFIGEAIKHSRRNFSSVFTIFCIADIMLLSFGVSWLKLISGAPLKTLFTTGFLPFIIGDIFKAILATVLYLKLFPRLEKIF